LGLLLWVVVLQLQFSVIFVGVVVIFRTSMFLRWWKFVKTKNMPNYIALLIPVFLLLIALEWWFSVKRNDQMYEGSNTVMNMAIGAIDQFGALLYLFGLFVCLKFSQTHFQVYALPKDWRQWVLAFLFVDLVGYWYHRCSHRINFLWAGHVTHHSSTYFNLSNGFRTSPFQGLFRIPFWMVLPVLGFDPLVLVITFKVVGLHDFFVHTSYIPKLGWLEYVIVTPSHHRVHHGKNDIYIDKNYGSALIIWDRMFGTYQEETEPVEYGLVSDYEDKNPVHAIFYHFKYLFSSILQIRGWGDKMRMLFMPPGWVPAGGLAMKSENVVGLGENSSDDDGVYAHQMPWALYLLISGIFGFVVTLYIYKSMPVVAEVFSFVLWIGNIVQASYLIGGRKYRYFGLIESSRLLLFSILGYWILWPLGIWGQMAVGMVLLALLYRLVFVRRKSTETCMLEA
jgi:sterol desaturase/sphingolipid hydroxylase (fatty acid hydroxylase superfamily)